MKEASVKALFNFYLNYYLHFSEQLLIHIN